MRRLFLALAAAGLLLAGCGEAASEEEGGRPAQAARLKLSLTPLELTAKAALDKQMSAKAAVAALEKRVKPAMDVYLLDPFSAQYRQLRAGKGGAVCGQVNAKNRLGAYVGFKDFVLGRDGSTLYVSKSSDGVRTEIYSSFADAYVNACASKQEQQRHAALVMADEDYYYPDYTPVESAADAMEDAAEVTELEDPFETD
jgi:hypothetical protein